MPVNIEDTKTLLGVVERSFPPSTLFRDLFFPNEMPPFVTAEVEMNYRKGGRKMAPFVVQRSKGVNMARSGFTTKNYNPPTMRPKRVISADDIQKRTVYEGIYSTITPAQRAMMLMAQDMADLIDMNTRRIEWMCAQLIINGSFEAKGYADDGKIALIDTVSFTEWTQKETLSGSDTWNNANANIYGDLKYISDLMMRNVGQIPTIMLCSFDVEEYLLNNASILKWLMIPDKTNLALMSLAPKITTPGVRRIGYIQALNLEIWAYDGVYEDDEDVDSSGNAVIKPYIPAGHVVVGVPGRGKQLFGAITQIEGDDFVTFASKHVPKVFIDKESDSKMLSLGCKCVPCPEFIDDWYTLKVI